MRDNIMQQFLTDIIGEEYANWSFNNMIFLFSGTGSGKTKFALEKIALSYLKDEKRVLYLVPRKILQEQIKADMMAIRTRYPMVTKAYNENFKVWTYQYLEEFLLSKKIPLNNSYDKYVDLIICDEFHYFLTDSIFNRNTQLSYNFIFHQDNVLKLLLTATPHGIMDYIINDIVESEDKKLYNIIQKTDKLAENPIIRKKCYNVNRTYKTENWIQRINKMPLPVPMKTQLYVYILNQNYDYLNVKYIIKDEEITEIIKKSKGKTIVFVSSIDNGIKIRKNLKENDIESIFITSENKNTESKEDVEELVHTNTFSKKVLITTSVLDVGVNFLDEEIENIIIGATEPIEFLQMLGRIRVIQEGQEVSLFIYARSKRYFQNLRDRYIGPKIESIEYLELCSDDYLNNIFKNDIRNYGIPKDYKEFLYIDYCNNDQFALNDLAKYRYRQLYTLYDEIYQELRKDKNAFIKKQLEWLGLQDTFSVENFYFLEMQKPHINQLEKAIKNEINEINNNSLKNIDHENCINMISKFQPLIRAIDNNLLRSNETLSVKKFNNVCKTYNIPYCIAQKQENIDNTKKTYYYLIKSDDNIIEERNLEISL